MPELSAIHQSRQRAASVELVPGLTVSLTYAPDAFTAEVSAAFRAGIHAEPARRERPGV